MANAAALSCTSTTGTEPKVCHDYSTSDRNPSATLTDTTLNGLTWGASTTDSANAVTLQGISQLIFRFNEGNDTPQETLAAPAYTIRFGGTGVKQILVLDGGTKGIEMANQSGVGADGNPLPGKLEVYYGNGDANRQFHLNLSKSQGSFSFKGNIVIGAGQGNLSMPDGNTQFIAEFGKDMVGDISVSRVVKGNASGHKTTLDFKGDASMKGNLDNKSGITTMTFESGNMEGNVSAYSASNFAQASNNVTFKRAGKITGMVKTYALANMPAANKPSTTITFEQGGAIEGGVVTESGKATITMRGQTATINGGILALSNGGPQHTRANTITFAADTNNIGGNIMADAGSNTITATDKTLTIGSATRASEYIEVKGGAQAINTITAQNLNINAGNIKVNMGKASTASTSTITATESANITAGTIFAKFGHNIIKAKDLTLNAGLIDSHGTSTDLAMTDNQITADESANITAKNIKARSGTNTFTLNGQNNTMTIGTLSSELGLNTITLKNGSITATSILGGYVNQNGAPYEGTNTITLENSSLTSETIAANGGINNIDFTGQGGDDRFEAKKITSSSGGVNNILLKDATSSSAITAERGGKNHIVLRNTAASSGLATHDITNNGGTIALALQDGNLQSSVKYGKNGDTTLFFAATSDGANDGFETADTDISAGKILGKTYQDGIKLSLKDRKILVNGKGTSLLDEHAKDFIGEDGTASLLTLKVEDSAGAGALPASKTKTITLKGLAVGEIKALGESANATTTPNRIKLDISESSAFAGSINLGTTNTKLLVSLDKASKILIADENLQLHSLEFKNASFDSEQLVSDVFTQTNSIVDLASLERANNKAFRLLQIGTKNQGGGSGGITPPNGSGLKGNDGLFRIHLNKGGSEENNQLGGVAAGENASASSNQYGHAYSDRILVHSTNNTPASGGGSGTTNPIIQHVQVVTDTSMTTEDLKNLSYTTGGTETAGNIAVFTAKNDSSNKPLVQLETEKSVSGFDVTSAGLKDVITDEFGRTTGGSGGGTGYTTYFINSVKTEGISLLNQKLTASALAANYDLYLANINSLNKRMGELRENNASQGAWARVFNGMQTTNFALSTRAIYTTIQAGYDYTFGFKGASNYLGFALSYANSMSKLSGNTKDLIDIDNKLKSITGMNSNAFEFAIYNAYVQDGASKATGFKNGLYTDTIAKFSYIMSNLDITGEDKLGTQNFAFTFSQELGYRFLLGNDREFYIDPQAEITLGYLDQSNLTRVLGKAFLKANQDSILTFRSRVGSSFGYKFDKFTQNKGFNSSLYLGTYFVSDVIAGGDIFMQSNLSQASFKALESTARFVLNLGTNFKIKDNTRIYFDFERSFGGKITTDYQLNLGVRYSFGTSKYTPYTESTQEAPKDNNTLKEVEPTKGYYIELLEKEDKKLTNKELKTLQNLKEELRIQTKTQNNKTMKAYLAGPYKDEKKAKEAKSKLEGVIKELKGKGNILEVE